MEPISGNPESVQGGFLGRTARKVVLSRCNFLDYSYDLLWVSGTTLRTLRVVIVIRKMVLACFLGCVVQISAAGPVVIASVSAQNSVFISGVGAQLLLVPQSGHESLVSGDTVVTKGLDSWATVRLGRAGLVEVGPESTVKFDRIDGVQIATISEGGLRYSLESGESLVIKAAGGVTRVGLVSSTELARSTGDPGSKGAVVIDDDGRLLAKNTRGQMNVVDGQGQTTAVPAGQLLAFQVGSGDAARSSFQVGATGQGAAGGSIGGLVFRDSNGNDLHDIDEQGVAGMSAVLYGTGPDGKVGGGDDVWLATVTTDSNGAYVFNHLRPGSYFISIDGQTRVVIYGGAKDPSAVIVLSEDEGFDKADFPHPSSDAGLLAKSTVDVASGGAVGGGASSSTLASAGVRRNTLILGGIAVSVATIELLKDDNPPGSPR